MRKFTRHTGIAAPLLRINIDTDAIIPSREMKRVSKHGLGEGLFAGWRYTEPGGRQPQPDFVLNRPEYSGASILLSGANFGCGSSREHAVWALKEYGIRAIIAAGFGAIFYGNCVRNGLLPIVLPEAAIKELAAEVTVDPRCRPLTIDLQQTLVLTPGGTSHRFTIEPAPQAMLLEGLDPIAVTWQQREQIAAFETRYRRRRPWLVIET
ncbi:3-isopropylmalate dehydratase small subunit [Exilibacterium tricleocarpae]|uniref:3-isopropylmalate dehydratase small subunit n=1 Tax=Exilibacterium tricleocarpae TaxID=2591008 RepID=A0A545TVK1_9GAMM|nr:3-isopropylmalate dehydratase small subunit [Exilibacterium tricleocarpae]TQV81249.1 3-isopropylmalate dehydratase small subunit [Exilibacterium tricleocarpae]